MIEGRKDGRIEGGKDGMRPLPLCPDTFFMPLDALVAYTTLDIRDHSSTIKEAYRNVADST